MSNELEAHFFQSKMLADVLVTFDPWGARDWHGRLVHEADEMWLMGWGVVVIKCHTCKKRSQVYTPFMRYDTDIRSVHPTWCRVCDAPSTFRPLVP